MASAVPTASRPPPPPWRLLAPSAAVVSAVTVQTAAAVAIPIHTPYEGALVEQGTSVALTLGALSLLKARGVTLPAWAWLLAGGMATNFAARVGVLVATRGDAAANQTTTVSRWDAASTTVAYFASTAAVYGAARHAWAPPPPRSSRRPSSAAGRAARRADEAFHWSAWLAVSTLAYPLFVLLPLLRGVPPPGWDAALATALARNAAAVNKLPQRTGSQGVVQVVRNFPLAEFAAQCPLVALVVAATTDARSPTVVLQNPSGARAVVYVTPDGADVVVAFAGTSSREQLEADLDWDSEPWAITPLVTVTVHQGFLAQYTVLADAVWADVAAKLAAVGPTARLIVSGHSLGGACATLAGLDAALVRRAALPPHADMLIYSFGAPQAGDANFVAAFNAHVPTCVRVCHTRDPVPHLLDARLVHVKGYMPVGEAEFVGWAHPARVYADAVAHWQLRDVVVSTFAPLGVVAVLLVLVVLVVAAATRRRDTRGRTAWVTGTPSGTPSGTPTVTPSGTPTATVTPSMPKAKEVRAATAP